MTITRIGQLTAEMNTLLDVALCGGGTYAPSISTVKAKTGARSYLLGPSSVPFVLSFAETTALRMGFWLNHNGATASPTLLEIQIFSNFYRVKWNATANSFVIEAGYGLDSYSPLVFAEIAAGTFSVINTWRHIGACLWYSHEPGEGYFGFYVDGVAICSATFVGSIEGSGVLVPGGHAMEVRLPNGAFCAGYQYDGAWTTPTYVDDFYVDNVTGESLVPLVVPSKRFLFSLANGAGAHSGWTPLSSTNISNVDDPITSEHDGDATYVRALAADLVDTYTTEDITLPVDHTITAVIPIAIARKTDAFDCKLSLIADDGSLVTTGTAQVLPASYGAVFERMPTQPDGTPWNETDFNAMEFGFKSAGAFA